MSNKKDYVYGTPVATEYRYYLDDSVSDPQDYHELFELLANAGENDLIRIIISNFGGSLVTCIAIVNAIRSTKAMTMGVLASVAYSAGGAIWLACEGQEVQQHVGFMAHDAQGGSFGSLYQQKQSIDHEMEILRSLYTDVYKGFLSEAEIELVLKNGDMWLSEKDIIERLEKRAELFKAEHEEYTEACQKQLDEMFGEPQDIPDWCFEHKKMTKAALVSLFKGDMDIVVDEQNRTFELIAVDKA